VDAKPGRAATDVTGRGRGALGGAFAAGGERGRGGAEDGRAGAAWLDSVGLRLVR
jgi:hypothetical protein